MRFQDNFGGRRPTSHERMTGRHWDASYDEGPAPWEVGGPQGAVVRLASAGAFTGSVLDAGCGTGENALYLAGMGLDVVGVDVARTALGIAREKAAGRGLEVEFVAADALQLHGLGRRFAQVLDCGLLHTFDGEERLTYVRSLAGVMEAGGELFVLCFRDAEGPERGPHPVSEEELRAVFRGEWEVVSIEPERIATRFHENGAAGWLARARRR